MTSPQPATPAAESLPDLKKQLNRLKTRSIQLKMDLHDLSEELPTGYERIPEMANETYDAFCEIDRLQTAIRQLERADG